MNDLRCCYDVKQQTNKFSLLSQLLEMVQVLNVRGCVNLTDIGVTWLVRLLSDCLNLHTVSYHFISPSSSLCIYVCVRVLKGLSADRDCGLEKREN